MTLEILTPGAPAPILVEIGGSGGTYTAGTGISISGGVISATGGGGGTYTAGTGLTLTTGAFAIDSSVVTLTGTQTLTNKTLGDVLTTGMQTFAPGSMAYFDAGSQLAFDGGTANFPNYALNLRGTGATEGLLTLNTVDPTSNRTITFPDATGTVALTTDIPAAPTATSLAAALNAGTEDATAADTDRLAVTSPAGGWMLLGTLWTWIKSKLSTSGDTITVNGPLILSSATRPTSSGTVTPDSNSLMTRDDVASHAYFSRRLFGNCSGTKDGTANSGATSRRQAAQGLFDGDLTTTATSGAFYKINIVSGVGLSSLMGPATSGSVNLSAKWSMFFRIAAQMGTNSHIYLCIGADGVSGIPSSGTSVGMEITSATVARLFRCNAGAAVYSSDATISGITTTTPTTDLFFWVDNSGTGTLSLFFAPKLFSASMPAKPASPIATLSGVASGFTGSDVAMYLRATAANPSVFTGLTMRDVVFTEY